MMRVLCLFIACSFAIGQEPPRLPPELEVPETIAGTGLGAMVGLTMLSGGPREGLSELSLAIDAKDIPRIRKAIANGASLKTERDQVLPLFRAVGTGDWEVVKAIVDAGGEEPGGLMWSAVFAGQTEIARIALTKGWSAFSEMPERRDEKSDDLLTFARSWCVPARDEKRPVYTLLLPVYAAAALGDGPNAEFVRSCGVTRLMALAFRGDIKGIEAELAGGADPNASDAANWTALFWAAAASENRADILKVLRDRGASVEGRDPFKLPPERVTGRNSIRITPLAVAAVEAVPEIIAALLPPDEGAPQAAVGQALLRAVIYKHRELALQLMKRGDVPAEAWTHAGGYAIDRVPSELFGDILAHAPKLDVQAQTHMMFRAVHFENSEAAAALLKYGIPMIVPSFSTKISWLAAAARCSTPVFTVVFQAAKERGELFDEFQNKRQIDFALHQAAVSGKVDNCRLLLDAGADVRARTDFGPIVTSAAGSGSVETVKLFIERGADVRAEPGAQSSALGQAMFKGGAEIVRVLVAAGADPNGLGIYGMPPLGGAVHCGNVEAFDALIAAGADPLATWGRDDLLTVAIAQERTEMVTKVIQAGVPIRTTGELGNGRPPHLEYARNLAAGDPRPVRLQIVKMLEEAIEKQK